MFILVQIDISQADIALFDDYEAQVLALVGNHRGTLIERLRSINGKSEVHLLHFPDAKALDAFRGDPARAALQELWLRCGASSSLIEVQRLSQPQPATVSL
ncbi:MAG: hypothetical protein PW790_06745 [Parvibaculaceae bacterium]|nr:hypothetical protein [Parvibaculaceae bacterium]